MAELRENMYKLCNARSNLELQLRKLQTNITYAMDWQDRVEFRGLFFKFKDAFSNLWQWKEVFFILFLHSY